MTDNNREDRRKALLADLYDLEDLHQSLACCQDPVSVRQAAALKRTMEYISMDGSLYETMVDVRNVEDFDPGALLEGTVSIRFYGDLERNEP